MPDVYESLEEGISVASAASLTQAPRWPATGERLLRPVGVSTARWVFTHTTKTSTAYVVLEFSGENADLMVDTMRLSPPLVDDRALLGTDRCAISRQGFWCMKKMSSMPLRIFIRVERASERARRAPVSRKGSPQSAE